MKTQANNSTPTRLKWLLRVGYGLLGLGVLLIMLPVVMPFDLFSGSHQFHRVVASDPDWLMDAMPIALMGIGALLVLAVRVIRSKDS